MLGRSAVDVEPMHEVCAPFGGECGLSGEDCAFRSWATENGFTVLATDAKPIAPISRAQSR